MNEKHSIREFKPETTPQTIEIPASELNNGSLYRPDLPAKVIVTTNVHHRDITGKVHTESCRFVRHLESKDDAFKRNLVIGEKWVEVNTGWITDIGYFFLRNNGGKKFNVVPTPEQLEEALSRVIEVGYLLVTPEKKTSSTTTETEPKQVRTMWDKSEHPATDHNRKPELPLGNEPIQPIALWLVRPGEDLQGRPVNEHKIYLRCQNGETSVTLFAIPS